MKGHRGPLEQGGPPCWHPVTEVQLRLNLKERDEKTKEVCDWPSPEVLVPWGCWKPRYSVDNSWASIGAGDSCCREGGFFDSGPYRKFSQP